MLAFLTTSAMAQEVRLEPIPPPVLAPVRRLLFAGKYRLGISLSGNTARFGRNMFTFPWILAPRALLSKIIEPSFIGHRNSLTTATKPDPP